MVFFIRSIFFQIFLNAYFVYRIRKSGTIPPWLKWVLYVVYTAEVLLYFTGLLAGERLTVEGFTLIQKISGVWMIGQAYLLLLLLIFDLIYLIQRRFLLFNTFKEKIVQQTKVCCFLIFLVFIGIRLYGGYENFLHPKIKNIPFEFNKPEGQQAKPKATYKVLVASDLHLGYIIDRKMVKQYVDLINSQNPDIVVIDGDLIDYNLRPLISGKMDEELRRIRAPKGVFFVPGNHEYKFNPELKLNWIAKAGFTILKDSVAVIDNRLCLIGRDDRSNKKRLYIEDLMSEVDLNMPCVFFAHQPGDIKDGYKYGIPLTVCGHTHGGQVFPMNLLEELVFTNAYGLKKKNNCYSYTTSGLGLSGFPLRIATDSEAVIFDIEIY